MNKRYIADNRIGNKGFSIVELIVSVAILSVATLSIMRAFSIGANTNSKAQSMQNATSLAEGIMEEVKYSSIEQLMKQYGISDPSDSTKKIAIAGTDKSITELAAKDMSAADINTRNSYLNSKMITGQDGVLIEEKAGRFVLYKPNVTANNGELFDVVATIDAIGSYANTAPTPADASDANTLELPVLSKLDIGNNAAISIEINKYDESAIPMLIDLFHDDVEGRDLYSTSAVIGGTGIGVSNKLKTVTISTSTSGNRVTVNCDVKYDATISQASKTKAMSLTRNIYTGEFEITPDVSDPSVMVYPGIYIFYMSMDEYVTKNSITLGHSAYMFDKEEIKFGTIDAGCKTFLVMNDSYSPNGTNSYKYNTTSVIDVTAPPTNMKTYIGGTEHIYDKKKDDYVYEINVAVTKEKRGAQEVCAFITSTKENY